QPDFVTTGAATTQGGLNLPSSVSVDAAGSRIFVGDGGNNRVLSYATPIAANQPNAAHVLGQATFTTGAAAATQSGLSGPFGVDYDGSKWLYVADDANNRVLAFDASALADGMNASFVLGQATFTANAAATTQSGLSQAAFTVVD